MLDLWREFIEDKAADAAAEAKAAQEAADAPPGSYPDLSNSILMGDIWQRPGLTMRERRLVVLTLLLLFLYGMVGWSLFGAALPESWGTIGRSMLTLFILLTLENFPTYLAEAEVVSPYAVVFFVIALIARAVRGRPPL